MSRPEPPPEDRPKTLAGFSFEDWKHRRIVVVASGLIYRGVLLGADESDLYLKGELRYLVLPLERITSVRLEDERDSFDPKKSVEPGFYSEPD